LSPVFTALLGLPLLGESFGWRTSLGCCASLAGVALVAQPGSAAVGWGRQRLWGMAFGFGGAVLAAGAYICIRLIGK
jgi:drug/metabolite transporter (DMT)-like permease